MKMEMQYALQEGKTAHISEVDKGLDCNCLCPACGERLVAKKGNIKVHHFAHYSQIDCSLAYETSLHLGVKRVLERERKLLFPATYKISLLNRQTLVSEPTLLEIDQIVLEERIESIIPDILVQVHGARCLIEIYVTHKVDDAKLEKVKKLNIAALEIDFSHINREVNDEVISEILLTDLGLKHWLFNPRIEQIEKADQDWFIHTISTGKIDAYKTTYTKYYFDSVFGCPLLPKRRRLWCVSHIRNCSDCDYYVSHALGTVYCMARYMMWKKSSYFRILQVGEEQAFLGYLDTQTYLDLLGVCPRCGNLLVSREGKKGKFLGCQSYPRCTYSRNIKE